MATHSSILAWRISWTEVEPGHQIRWALVETGVLNKVALANALHLATVVPGESVQVGSKLWSSQLMLTELWPFFFWGLHHPCNLSLGPSFPYGAWRSCRHWEAPSWAGLPGWQPPTPKSTAAALSSRPCLSLREELWSKEQRMWECGRRQLGF